MKEERTRRGFFGQVTTGAAIGLVALAATDALIGDAQRIIFGVDEQSSESAPAPRPTVSDKPAANGFHELFVPLTLTPREAIEIPRILTRVFRLPFYTVLGTSVVYDTIAYAHRKLALLNPR